MKYTKLLLFCCLAAMMTTGQAVASPIFMASSSVAFTGYERPFALDTGAPRFNTDFAGDGTTLTASQIHLDFDFGAATLIRDIVYTDRLTSGAPNGTQTLSTSVFVTGMRYIVATDALFTSVVWDSGVISRTAPVLPASYVEFQTTTSANQTGQYLRWEVVTANGGAFSGFAGAADFEFVPEPSTSVLLLLGSFMGLGLFLHRRRVSQS